MLDTASASFRLVSAMLDTASASFRLVSAMLSAALTLFDTADALFFFEHTYLQVRQWPPEVVTTQG